MASESVSKAEPPSLCAATTPPDIENGWLHAYFMYDIADTIDVAAIQSTAAFKGFEQRQLQLRAAASPEHIKFQCPPVVAGLPSLEINGNTFVVGCKIYDYGVVSLKLSLRFSGSWAEYAELSRKLRTTEPIAVAARGVLDALKGDLKTALKEPHNPVLEDYYLFHVESFKQQVDSQYLMRECGGSLASLIVGESRHLTGKERDEVLRVSFSYFPEDLAIIEWDSAFIFDSASGAEAVKSIVEFANTQLLELRTYDARLDQELQSIYRLNLPTKKANRAFERREADERARKLGCLLVDIRELTDRASNSLKITGDAYYARLYRGAFSRLGIADWQEQIEKKLRDLGEIYRFFTDEAHQAQAEFLELIVIWLILIEVVLGILTLAVDHWH